MLETQQSEYCLYLEDTGTFKTFHARAFFELYQNLFCKDGLSQKMKLENFMKLTIRQTNKSTSG
jgi:hypothetical protein